MKWVLSLVKEGDSIKLLSRRLFEVSDRVHMLMGVVRSPKKNILTF